MSSLKGRQEEFSLLWERVSLFVLFRPPTDGMRPAHSEEGIPHATEQLNRWATHRACALEPGSGNH